MIIGDLLLVLIMGFYAGVGIWESGTARHILGMILPAMAVWLLMAVLLKLYRGFPRSFVNTRVRQFPKLCGELITAQKVRSLIIVWGVTCLAACLWQAFYWRNILRSGSYFYRFGFGTILWYASSYGTFFFLWRAFWTVLSALIILTRENRPLRIACRTAGIALLLYAAAVLLISLRFRQQIYTKTDNIPQDAPRTALVFGAGVYLNGEPSAVLTDRVLTAVDLYHKGLIDEMIMSGDNSDRSRNEVDHMIALAVESGVPESAILRDDQGVHTAESCWNARNVFGKEDVIFISQGFHAVRILMTARSYGLTGIVVRADRRIYNIFSWSMWYILDWIRLPVYFVHYYR